MIATARLRKAATNSVRGAASLLADALATARSAGAARPLIVRADSGLYIANGRRHAMDVENQELRRNSAPSLSTLRIVEVQLAEAPRFPSHHCSSGIFHTWAILSVVVVTVAESRTWSLPPRRRLRWAAGVLRPGTPTTSTSSAITPLGAVKVRPSSAAGTA